MELIRNYRKGKITSRDVQTLNNVVLSLMISVAATSIAWTLSMHVISGDFYNGFISAKLVFRERDLTQMDNAERDIWKHDLDRILNETYTNEALDEIKADALIMPKLIEYELSTKKPKNIKIAHVFQAKNSEVPDAPTISDSTDDIVEGGGNDLEMKEPNIFNKEEDRKFLSLMTIDIHQTRWNHNFAVDFIYSFPFFSEIIAIIWTAMCFIFQSGVKRTWGLPKPWRIVIPSIIMFSIMTIANLCYLILANGFLKTFCSDLRENLSKPDAISCGDAMAALRPVIRSQALSHNTYLIIFRISYILAMILWIIALVVMLLRFVLAIDFQLVDVETTYDRDKRQRKLRQQEFADVQLNSPKTPKTVAAPLNLRNETSKSEDDFESAKSHLSEVGTPLLVQCSPTKGNTKT